MSADPPRTDWLDLAVMSRDDEEYQDKWGTILDDENFERLDRETMLSGPYADRPSEAPFGGAKYHATDANAVFAWDADDGEWTVLNSGTEADPVPGTTHLASVQADEVAAGVPTGTDDHVRLVPAEDALREGYVVGQAPHASVVIDPRDYSTDADAIQAAHDQLTEELGGDNEAGIVYIPPFRPDETQFVITETVTFEGDGTGTGSKQVVPRGWGFNGGQGGAIAIDIDDGSPAFELRTMKGQGQMIGNLAFEGLDGGEDCEALRLHNMIAWRYEAINVRGIGGERQNGAITFDGRCFNSIVNNCRFVGGGYDVADGNFIAFRDLEDTRYAPGELKFGLGMSTYAPPESPYGHVFDTAGADWSDGVPSDIYITGRYEGYGDHGINWTDGKVTLGAGLELGRPEDNDGSGTHRVYHTGFKLIVDPTASLVSSGTPNGASQMYVDVSEGRIGAFDSDEEDLPVIEIPDDSGTNLLLVPRPEEMEAPLEYPDPPWWGQLRHPDGWRLYREGTGLSIGAGERVELSHYLGGEGGEIDVRWSMASDPEGNPILTTRTGWTDSYGKMNAYIEEVGGEDGATVDWQIYRRS